MKRWLCAALLMVVSLAVVAVPAAAQRFAPFMINGAGGGGGGGPPPPAYVGPGDVQAYTAWYGTRAYNVATIGQPVMNVCNSTGGIDQDCQDLVTGPDGNLVPKMIPAVGGVLCPSVGVTVCTIRTRYSFPTNSFPVTQATVALRPLLQANALGNRSCVAWNGSQYMVGTTAPWAALPASITWLAQRNGTPTGAYNSVLRASGTGFGTGFDQTANRIFFFNQGVSLATTLSAADGVPHSVQLLVNGALSDAYLDGSFTGSISQGTATPSGNITLSGDGTTTERLVGIECEVGYLAGDASATNPTAYLNQAAWFALPVSAPSAAIVNPSNASQVSGVAGLTATCAPGCTNLAWAIDGGTSFGADTAPPYTASLDTTTLSNGNHTLTATGTSPAGQSVASITINVQNGGPPPPVTGAFFIATNGNDSNNGLSPTSSGCPVGSTGTCGPWATPHGATVNSVPIRCSSTGGDLILVQPGVYNNAQFDGFLSGAHYWPVEDASCTGHGVFRTIKCNGTTLGACIISQPGFHWQFWLDSSYWIVQGFQGVNSVASGNACFVANYQPNFSPYNAQYNAHDVIFINNWCHDSQRSAVSQGDYTATIGLVGYNTAGGSADSNMDWFEPYAFDTLPGTHIFSAGTFLIKSTVTDQDTDGEGIIMDDWAFSQCHPAASGCQTPYTGIGVISQSLVVGNASEGIEKLNGGATPSYVYSTTFWDNNQSNQTQGNAYVEVGSQSGGGIGSTLNIDHVLAVAIRATNTWHTVPRPSGSTSGTTFTANAGFSDWIVPNAVLSGGTPALPANTTITAQTSGSGGRNGTYTINCPGGCPASTSGTYLADGHGGPNFQPNFPINAIGTNASGLNASNTAYINTANPAQSCNQAPFGGGCTASFSNSVQADPQFASPAIPGGTFTTGVGGTGPDCSTFATTTDCMRAAGIIGNFRPTNTASNIPSMGYPDPQGAACGSDAAIIAGRWPSWIPPSLIPAGLVITPCVGAAPIVQSCALSSGGGACTGPTTGGTGVVLTGQNFGGGAGVSFGGTAATGVTVNSATQITVNSPAVTNAGAVAITVTVAGQSGTLTNGFTYTAPAAPTVTACALTVGGGACTGPTTGGTQVTLTGTNFGTGATVRFSGTAATGVTVNSPTQITATSPLVSNTGPVDITVTVAGQSGTLSGGFTYTTPPAYVAQGVAFNGAALATKTGALALSNSSSGLLSLWFSNPNASGTGAHTFLDLQAGGSEYFLYWIGGTSATFNIGAFINTFLGEFHMGGTTLLSSMGTNTWVHALASWNLATGRCQLYLNGQVETLSTNNCTNGTIPYLSGTTPTLAATTPSDAEGLLGSMADMQLWTGIDVDLSVATNRAYFVSGTGGAAVTVDPALPIAHFGQPCIELNGKNGIGTNGATWLQNLGTCGGFTWNGGGSITVSATNPPSAPTGPPPTVTACALTAGGACSGPTSGGTQVNLTGTNFAAGAVVRFGGTASSIVTVNGSNSITATSPPVSNAGTVDITVTVSTQTGTLAGGFTYTQPPAAPAVSAIAPTNGPVAGGTAVTISGSNLTSATGVSFGGTTVNPPYSSNTANQIQLNTPAGPGGGGAVDVRVTTGNGTSPAGAVSYTYNVPSGGSVPVITGATLYKTSPVSGDLGTLSVANGVTSCALAAGGMNTSGFAVRSGTNSCIVSHAASLTGGGNAYLNVTASNANGTSLVTPMVVQWRAWNSNVLNTLSGDLNLKVTANTPLTAGTIVGRTGTDSVSGAAEGDSCTVSGDARFSAVPSAREFHCIISVAAGNNLTNTSGSTTFSVSEHNPSGTGSAGTINFTWTTLAAGVPVVSQAQFMVGTPATGNAVVGNVPATNAPTSCALTGDPGNPVKYFTIAPNGNNCQIRINPAAGNPITTAGAAYGSPVLYVTATNSSGTSIGNYVVVGLALPNSPCTQNPGDAATACTDARTAGMTNLVMNVPMDLSKLDVTESGLPGFYFYGLQHNNTGPMNYCDRHGTFGAFNGAQVCDPASQGSPFNTYNKNQDGDTWTQGMWTATTNPPTLVGVGAPWNSASFNSCGMFGREPYNHDQHLVGQAFGGAKGYFIDFYFMVQTNAPGVAGGVFSHPLQLQQDLFIVPQPTTRLAEFDLADQEPPGITSAGFNIYGYNAINGPSGPAPIAYFGAFSLPGNTPDPPGGVFHHWQALWIPVAQGGGTGRWSSYLDGALQGTMTYTASDVSLGPMESHFHCWFWGTVSGFTESYRGWTFWQHP